MRVSAAVPQGGTAAFCFCGLITCYEQKALFAVIFTEKHELFDSVLHVRNKTLGSLETENFPCYDASEQMGNALPISGADTGPACHGMCAGHVENS